MIGAAQFEVDENLITFCLIGGIIFTTMALTVLRWVVRSWVTADIRDVLIEAGKDIEDTPPPAIRSNGHTRTMWDNIDPKTMKPYKDESFR